MAIWVYIYWFLGWNFLTLDFDSHSGGLIIGWGANFSLLNSFIVISGLCIEVFCKSLVKNLTLLNMYGLYEDKQSF